MLAFIRRFSIKIQLLALVICTVSIIFWIIIMSYFRVTDAMEKINRDYSEDFFIQVKNNIADNYDMLSTMLSNAAYSNSVQNYMTETDSKEVYQYFKNVDTLIYTMQGVKSDYILDFVVMGVNGNNYFMHGYNKSTVDYLNSLKLDIINKYHSGNTKLTYSNVERDCYVIATSVHPVNEETNYNKKIGIVAIIVDTKIFSFKENSKISSSSTKFYLLDKQNNVFSTNNMAGIKEAEEIFKSLGPEEAGSININTVHNKYIVNYAHIPQLNGKIVSIITEDDLFKELEWIRKLAYTLSGISLLVLCIPFYVIIHNILQPLKKFMCFMNNLKAGSLSGLKQRINLEGYSEIEIVSCEFNNMMDEIDGLTHRLVSTSSRLYEAELQKKQAEMMYLISQINPHFLYNTLESMVATAFDEKADKTAEMISSLVTIFRYSVKGSDVVELREELEIIKAYIYIQQIRFTNTLDVVYQFDEATLRCRLPKITLQPIVENAVFHGLETKMGRGHLFMGSRLDDEGNVFIWVNDDGVGIQKEKLDEIKNGLKEIDETGYPQNNKKNIGITNVNNRIKLIYGMQYGLSINSQPWMGTVITIKLPYGEDSHV